MCHYFSNVLRTAADIEASTLFFFISLIKTTQLLLRTKSCLFISKTNIHISKQKSRHLSYTLLITNDKLNGQFFCLWCTCIWSNIFLYFLFFYFNLIGWLFCFTSYQPFWGHLMPNQVILIKTLFLFGSVLSHINHGRLFNAKSIFIQINSSILNNSVQHKYSFFCLHKAKCQTVLFQTIQFSISTVFFVYTELNVKTVLFQTIQFSISAQFSSI